MRVGFLFYLATKNISFLKRVVVSVTNDLSTDQRVHKACSELHALDYEVILIGRQLKNSVPISRGYKTKRFKLLFTSSFLFYAEYNLRLFFYLLFTKKDFLVSNDLDTLLPNYLISKFQNKKLVYDSHELFTEVPELVDSSFVKGFWSRLEKLIFPKLKNVIVVSESIALFYKEKYNVSCHVIRNIPQTSDVQLDGFPIDVANKKIILYQGSINKGRGLELIIDSMSLLEDHILVIIGDGDIIVDLKKKVLDKNLNHIVFFLGKMPPSDLKKISPHATIGISLEEDLGLNYRYALPNKLFDYIHAEVPVIASDLPEIKKIVEKYKIGSILKNRTPEKLAELILSMDKENYLKALKTAKKELNWNTEKEKLISIFKHL
jgi:glycosyltransferase involved in cell wall biosynthesis